MKYFSVEKNEEGNFSIEMTSDFYKFTSPHYKKGSYFNVLYRLFGLLPQDFYHYVGSQYGAQFKKNKYIRHVNMTFREKEKATEFCKELNRRFHYCVQRGDFIPSSD